MPDTQAMPDDGEKKRRDPTQDVPKGAESSGGNYPHAPANGDRDPHYHGPKNDGSEGGETVRKD